MKKKSIKSHRNNKNKYRKNLAIEFKNEKSEFKIAIVVDMWLTGFDVHSLAIMYIDKPMKGQNIMQAIARINRVYKDKEAGLIVDYIGMAAVREQYKEITDELLGIGFVESLYLFHDLI